jgi:hypothetical protein
MGTNGELSLVDPGESRLWAFEQTLDHLDPSYGGRQEGATQRYIAPSSQRVLRTSRFPLPASCVTHVSWWYLPSLHCLRQDGGHTEGWR